MNKPISWNLGASAASFTQEILSPQPRVDYVPSGFPSLDKFSPLERGRVFVLAGGHRMGSSSFAMSIAMNVASGNTSDATRRGICIFSLDLTPQDYAMRVTCACAEVSPYALGDGPVSRKNVDRVELAARQLEDIPVIIEGADFPDVDGLCVRANKLKAQLDFHLLVIDKFPLLLSPGYTGHDHHDLPYGQYYIAKVLCQLARQLKIPVIVLADVVYDEGTSEHGLSKDELFWVPQPLIRYPDVERHARAVWLIERPCRFSIHPERESRTLALLHVFGQLEPKTLRFAFEDAYFKFSEP